jgi:hypothetical protein
MNQMLWVIPFIQTLHIKQNVSVGKCCFILNLLVQRGLQHWSWVLEWLIMTGRWGCAKQQCGSLFSEECI